MWGDCVSVSACAFSNLSILTSEVQTFQWYNNNRQITLNIGISEFSYGKILINFKITRSKCYRFNNRLSLRNEMKNKLLFLITNFIFFGFFFKFFFSSISLCIQMYICFFLSVIAVKIKIAQ